MLDINSLNIDTITNHELLQVVEELRGLEWSERDAELIKCIRKLQFRLEDTVSELVIAKLECKGVSGRKLAVKMGVTPAWISLSRNKKRQIKKCRHTSSTKCGCTCPN